MTDGIKLLEKCGYKSSTNFDGREIKLVDYEMQDYEDYFTHEVSFIKTGNNKWHATVSVMDYDGVSPDTISEELAFAVYTRLKELNGAL